MMSVMAAPPQSAVSTWQADRDAAFHLAVRDESRRLFAVAFAILRDPAEAEDAVQETMMKAWSAWHQLRDTERRRPWLTRICVNHCIGRKRLRLSRWLLPGSDAVERGSPTQDDFVCQDLDLDRAYQRLSVQQRAVVVLHYHHGYPLDECADLMGCRPGTVRSHLNRALTTLRREVGADA